MDRKGRGKEVSLGGFDAELTVLWERARTARNYVAEAQGGLIAGGIRPAEKLRWTDS